MDPIEFYNISQQIHQLLNTTIPAEIIWRTIANRVYYYLYHITRGDLSYKLAQYPFIIQRELLESKFSYHKNVIQFYERTSNLLKTHGLTDEAEYAEENKDILDLYCSTREVADYNIRSPHQILKRSFENFPLDLNENSINFKTPSDTWKKLLTSDPPIAAEILLENNDKILKGLEQLEEREIKRLI